VPRGHPKGRRPTPCRHCDDVDLYHEQRGAELEWIYNGGGWRDERNRAVTYKEWLQKPGRFYREEAA